MKSVAIDEGICSGIPPSLVLLLCPGLEEVLVPDDVVLETTRRYPSIKTLVCVRSARVEGLEEFWDVIKWVTETDGFPALKRIVIVNPTFDNLEEGDAENEKGLGLRKEDVEVVNRYGVRICAGKSREWQANGWHD